MKESTFSWRQLETRGHSGCAFYLQAELAKKINSFIRIEKFSKEAGDDWQANHKGTPPISACQPSDGPQKNYSSWADSSNGREDFCFLGRPASISPPAFPVLLIAFVTGLDVSWSLGGMSKRLLPAAIVAVAAITVTYLQNRTEDAWSNYTSDPGTGYNSQV